MIPLLAIIFFADRLLIHVCFDAFIPELVSGPRAIGTIGCLVASFAVAGKQSMHWLDLAAAAAASDVCVADCITLRSSGVISFLPPDVSSFSLDLKRLRLLVDCRACTATSPRL